jgi:hypothetical protein
VQYTSKVERTVCTAENTTESRSAIRTRFTSIWRSEVRISKRQSQRPEPTPALVFSLVYNTSYLLGSACTIFM